MVYNCGYPIWHTFVTPTDGSTITYDILIGTTVIYSGQLLPFDSTASTIRIDISHVCRSYLETYYENIPDGDIVSSLVPVNGLKSTVNTFIVSSGNNSNANPAPDVQYNVIYDYNTDYELTRTDVGNRNNPLLLEADPRQIISITGYAVSGTTSFLWKKNEGIVRSYPSLGTRYQTLSLRLNSPDVNAQEGDTITLSQGTASYEYRIVKPCKNRFALYYVNKMGGLDSLLCSGRYLKRWNSIRTDVRLYDDRTNSKDFQKTRIFQNIGHRLELNTGWLDDDKAEMIDGLIYSPKIWIHDLDKNTITSCLITDSSYQADRFHLDDVPAHYTINVEESQLHERQ